MKTGKHSRFLSECFKSSLIMVYTFFSQQFGSSKSLCCVSMWIYLGCLKTEWTFGHVLTVKTPISLLNFTDHMWSLQVLCYPYSVKQIFPIGFKDVQKHLKLVHRTCPKTIFSEVAHFFLFLRYNKFHDVKANVSGQWFCNTTQYSGKKCHSVS